MQDQFSMLQHYSLCIFQGKSVCLFKLEILLNGKSVDALSSIAHETQLKTIGKTFCEKLKDVIPRYVFMSDGLYPGLAHKCLP